MLIFGIFCHCTVIYDNSMSEIFYQNTLRFVYDETKEKRRHYVLDNLLC